MKAASYLRNAATAVIAIIAVCSAGITRADEISRLIYSFEDGLQGWTSTSASLTTSTSLGVTDGTRSMLIDNLTFGFKNDPAASPTISTGNVFNYLQEAANAITGGDNNVKLEFDFAWNHSNATNLPQWAQLGFYMNSSAGFKEYQVGQLIGGNIGTNFPVLDAPAVSDGVTLTSTGPTSAHVAIPLGPRVTIAPGTFYQMGFKSNGNWGGSVDWAVDKILVSGITVVPTTAETIFSWETPDDPGTTTIDERFEGWTTGFQSGHAHANTTTGATDGTRALQIDRTSLGSGFTWGSQFQISSDTDPGAGQTIDPVIQAAIDELADKILNADRVAFDVTYQYVDRFPLPDPTAGGTSFALNISDETGEFYQAASGSIDVLHATQPTTSTIEIPLSQFNSPGGKNLLIDGFVAGTDYLRIALATNTDGAQIYQIDSFRLITEVPEGVPGDYNNDDVVDAADYVIWRKGVAPTNTPQHYEIWRQHFGETLGIGSAANPAVPEPTSILMLLAALVGSLIRFRR